MTQIQKHLSQSQHHYQNQLVPKQNPNSSTAPISSSMWNPREQHQEEEEDESWEVRAFAEDTSRNNSMGTTWPPRSYTCTFCRREFRSAQALGGHMNVHRRDRARLHQPPPQYYPSPPASAVAVSPNNPTSSFINIPPHHEIVANGGLCLLYHLPSPNNIAPNPLNACGESVVPFSTSTLLSVSSNSYPPNNNLMVMPAPSFDFTAGMINGFSSCSCSSSKVEEEEEEEEPINSNSTNINHGHHEEELDLELRLGNRSTTPS